MDDWARPAAGSVRPASFGITTRHWRWSSSLAQAADARHTPHERNVNVVTAFKDLVGLLLLAALLPVWMVAGLAALLVVVMRQLLWWARDNTTAVSRATAPVTSPPQSPASRAAQGTPGPPDPLDAVELPSLAGTPASVSLRRAVPGVSAR